MPHRTTQGLRDATQPVSALQTIQWAVATGTVNAITATYPDTVYELIDGLCLGFRASGANTSTTPTFSPDGLTARTIVKKGGQALAAGDIPGADSEVLLRYNQANTRWELLSFDNPTMPWVAAGGTADAITATYAPAISAVSDGMLLAFRASATNATTTPTFSPNGLTARTIYKEGGTALLAGDIPGAGAEMLVRYRSSATRWELLNPASGPKITAQLATFRSTYAIELPLFKILAADDTGGQNVNTAQPWFPTAGGVTVEGDTTYFFRGFLWTTRSAGSSSHTTGVLFGGTATLTAIGYAAWAKTGDANDLQSWSGFWASAATTLVVKASSASTTENVLIRVEGMVRINASGTLIPQFIYSSAPGGAPTIKRESYFMLQKLGAGAVASQGSWA
jgi:hypothetical protein